LDYPITTFFSISKGVILFILGENSPFLLKQKSLKQHGQGEILKICSKKSAHLKKNK
jgi:hypothetical protein